jgi:AcrR family transcriptional regulator
VYATFGDKASLLKAIADHAFFGGSQEGEGEKEFVDVLMEVGDPLERLRMCVARTAAGYHGGLAALGRMMGGASMGDDGLDRFVAEMIERRHEDIRSFTSLIVDRPLPSEASRFETMIDELEALTSEAVYWILVVERGWSLAAYERHVVEMFVTILDRHGLAPPLESEGT